jgi:hypothetical protein
VTATAEARGPLAGASIRRYLSRVMRDAPTDALPPDIAAWFARRGWTPHRHQLDLLDARATGS